MKIAFISAGWHTDMVGNCRESCVAHLKKNGIDESAITFVNVPGSLEIPWAAQKLCASDTFSAVLCSGFVVDGGIYRHDFVAKAIIDGITSISINTGVPVLSAILTPHHFHEHEDHTTFFREHMKKKGEELAQGCLEVLQTAKEIDKATRS